MKLSSCCPNIFFEYVVHTFVNVFYSCKFIALQVWQVEMSGGSVDVGCDLFPDDVNLVGPVADLDWCFVVVNVFFNDVIFFVNVELTVWQLVIALDSYKSREKERCSRDYYKADTSPSTTVMLSSSIFIIIHTPA